MGPQPEAPDLLGLYPTCHPQSVRARSIRAGLDAGGRGMAMADFDGDGDQDVLINNLRSPSQVFENQLCSGHSLLVDLRQDSSGNTRALGAELLLHTTSGTLRRSVQVAGGYLSGRSARQHFGLPFGSRIVSLEVIWPDNTASKVDWRPFQQVRRLTITRTPAQTK